MPAPPPPDPPAGRRRPAGPRPLSEDDLRLWAAYSRSLKLLPGKSHVAAPPEPPRPAQPPEPPPAGAAVKPGAPSVAVNHAPAGLDRASWRRFRIGQIRPARTLDLHGLTAAHAHRATMGFLHQAHAQQQRCVEIITGNGDILARELPLWLDAPPLRAMVLALAYPHPGNTGAVRILLRRIRQTGR